MKIDKLLKEGFSVSFEFFPPKDQRGEEQLLNTLKELKTIKPTFVSMTYGAGGSTRDRTINWVKRIKEEFSLNVMAHLTCIAHTKEELLEILRTYREMGVDNLLALRGDPPKEGLKRRGCSHAEELVLLIRENFKDWFCICVASYPEGHNESPNLDWEVKYFKRKVERGANFSITQMFFINDYYYEFLQRCERAGINIPIIPGIMPITNFKQIFKFASMCGATIPKELTERLERVAHKREEVEKIGIEYATKQCIDLIENGVPGLHFYTLNKSRATLEIFKNIKDIVRWRS